jgi:hypothetical protein
MDKYLEKKCSEKQQININIRGSTAYVYIYIYIPLAAWRRCLHQKPYEQQQIFGVHEGRNMGRKGIPQHTFFSRAYMQHRV